jgi:predicted nucleic acid-binding protein
LIVVDASFLVMMIADDDGDGSQARGRARGEELVAPHLIDLEVASVLRRSVLSGGIPPQRARQALQDLHDLAVERVAHTTLLPRVWELRANFTTYDACYIALAELFRAPLLTFDAKMASGPGAQCAFEVFPQAAADGAG